MALKKHLTRSRFRIPETHCAAMRAGGEQRSPAGKTYHRECANAGATITAALRLETVPQVCVEGVQQDRIQVIGAQDRRGRVSRRQR
nr:hypothetical protein GCM10020063_018790 [Dactylosporangium thailandense]